MKNTFYAKNQVVKHRSFQKFSGSVFLFSTIFMLLFLFEDVFAGRKKNQKEESNAIVSQTCSIENLPVEVFMRVGHMLHPQDRARARQVCQLWRYIFSLGDFAYKAQVNLRGDLLTGGICYFFSPDERSRFIPHPDSTLNRVRQIQLVGPYPGKKASLRKQEVAEHKLGRVCHPYLESLSWIRSSRRLPVEPLVRMLPQIKHLRQLTLREGVLQDSSLLPLLTLDALAGLEYLDLSRNCLSFLTIQHLRQSGLRQTLKSIVLSGNSLGAALLNEDDLAFVYEEENDGFPVLETLDVSKNSLSSESRFLEDLGLCPNIQTLKLSQNALGTQGLTPWLALPKDGGLLSLDMRSTSAIDLTALSAKSCSNLTFLNVSGNRLEENATYLSGLDFRQSLETLSLSQCGITFESLTNILAALYPSMTSLILSNNTLSHGSAELLAKTSNLPKLSRLSLMHTHTPWLELKQLVCTRPLSFLDLRRNMGVCPRLLRKALSESEYEHMQILPTPLEPSSRRATFSYKPTKNYGSKNTNINLNSEQEGFEEEPEQALSQQRTLGVFRNSFQALENS